MTEPLSIALPPEIVEAIAQRAAEIVLGRVEEQAAETSSPWLYGAKAAAQYLGWPVGRIQKLTAANAIPFHRVPTGFDETGQPLQGQRVAYRRDDLDRWLEQYREGRRP